MDIEKRAIVLFGSVFVTVVLWCGLLGMSGVTIDGIISPSRMEQSFSQLLSFGFIAFVLVFPITFAAAGAMARKGIGNAALFSVAGAALGGIIGMLAFGITGYWLLGIFYLIALFIFTLSQQENGEVMRSVDALGEEKAEKARKYIEAGGFKDAFGISILVISIGVVIAAVAVALPNNELYVNEFEGMVMEMAVGGMGEGASSSPQNGDLSQFGTEMYVNLQKQNIQQIMATPQYMALEASSTPEAGQFVTMMEGIKEQLYSGEYEEMVGEEIHEQQGAEEGGANEQVFGMLKERLPLFALIEEFFWVLQAVTALFLFQAILFIIKPLGAVYNWVLGRALGEWTGQKRR